MLRGGVCAHWLRISILDGVFRKGDFQIAHHAAAPGVVARSRVFPFHFVECEPDVLGDDGAAFLTVDNDHYDHLAAFG